MATNRSHPSKWSDPELHPDWGVDSSREVELLRKVVLLLMDAIPGIRVSLVVEREYGNLYTTIDVGGEFVAELEMARVMPDTYYITLPYAKDYEHELLRRSTADVIRLVSAWSNGVDLSDEPTEID